MTNHVVMSALDHFITIGLAPRELATKRWKIRGALDGKGLCRCSLGTVTALSR
jgi:hypothetical protein